MRFTFAFLLSVASIMPLIPAQAVAQDSEFYFGQSRNHDRGYDREYRRDRPDGGCSPREAIRNALRRGMQDPQITSVDRRRIVIDGYGRRNEYTKLVLANREGCPRLG